MRNHPPPLSGQILRAWILDLDLAIQSVYGEFISHRIFFFFLFRAAFSVPRLGVKLELQLLAYSTATVKPDSSHVGNIQHRSWQHRIPDPLSKSKDRTHILMDTSWIPFCCAMKGTSQPQDFHCYTWEREVLPRDCQTDVLWTWRWPSFCSTGQARLK